MLDKALNMLGPDAEILSEILTDRKLVLVIMKMIRLFYPTASSLATILRHDL